MLVVIKNDDVNSLISEHPVNREFDRKSTVLLYVWSLLIFIVIVVTLNFLLGLAYFKSSPDLNVVGFFAIEAVILFCFTTVLINYSGSFSKQLFPSLFGPKFQLSNNDVINRLISLSSSQNYPAISRLLLGKELRGRSNSLKNRTGIILLTIGLILVAAAMIVVFAGQLTSLDAAAIGPTDRLKTELKEVDTQLTAVAELRGQLRRLDQLKNIVNPPPTVVQEIDDINRKTSRLDYTAAYPKDNDALDILYTGVVARRDLITQLLSEAWRKEVTSDRGYNDTKYIIATAITRVGVVVILVFLVQILLGLYRYNTRLLTYYNSMIDVLTLWNGETAHLAELSKYFSSPNVDFGKEPKHPLEDLIKMLETQIKKGTETSQRENQPKN